MQCTKPSPVVHPGCWTFLGVPMRGLFQLSWYLQRLPWALDKTYLGSRLQALAEGRSDILRGCSGYPTNVMSGQEQEVWPIPSCTCIIKRMTMCGVEATRWGAISLWTHT